MKKEMLIIGIMTGTSMDGVDVSLCKFNSNPKGKHTYELIEFECYDYPAGLKDKIITMINTKASLSDLSQLSFYLSDLFAKCVNNLIEKSGIDKSEITAIGVHGQTLWHQPRPKQFIDHKLQSTLQLINLPALAEWTGIKVIGDFRSADIALGGQGAPLVPIFDFEFLSSPKEDVIALNIGGIANITYIPKICDNNHVIAFDTGPGNVLIDMAMKYYFQKNYDEGGKTALKGKLIKDIFDELKKHTFISQAPPKSTGREMFNVMLFNKYFAHKDYAPEDVINTLTTFTAWSVAENIRLFAKDEIKLIVSGGGSKNNFLIRKLQKELPKSKVISADDIGLNSDAKESICMAYLAYRNLLNLPGNLPSVTGASKFVKLGVQAG